MGGFKAGKQFEQNCGLIENCVQGTNNLLYVFPNYNCQSLVTSQSNFRRIFLDQKLFLMYFFSEEKKNEQIRTFSSEL